MTCKKLITKWIVLATVGSIAGGPSFAQDMPTARFETIAKLGSALSMPSDVDAGESGQIYVVDGGNHQVAVYDSAGQRITTLGERGGKNGQFEDPVGLGIGPSGKIYVADKGNQRLQVFDSDGRFDRAIVLEEDGNKIDPVDVAVSANGRELFITANNSHRVVVFSGNGKYLRGWGGEGEEDGQFRYPATIDIDPAGNVLVVDVLNARVQKFDAEGNFLSSFGSLGGKPGTFFRPKGIAVDTAGRSYVSDSFLGVIQVFDANGVFSHALGEAGEAAVFDTPVGMTVVGNRLLVVQMLTGNVLVLEPKAVIQVPTEATP
jgi:DNA-binding beta-propeller fold protein YncE